MIVDISLDCVGSQRLLWGTLIRIPRPLSLMFPYSGRVMIVLRRSLYCVVSDGCVLGLFVPLPPAVLTGFPQGASISLEDGIGQIVFLSAVFVVFHLRYRNTLIPVTPSKGPWGLHGLSPHSLFLGSKGWILPRPLHPMWNRGPREKAPVRWRCFPGRSALLPMRRALRPRKS